MTRSRPIDFCQLTLRKLQIHKHRHRLILDRNGANFHEINRWNLNAALMSSTIITKIKSASKGPSVFHEDFSFNPRLSSSRPLLHLTHFSQPNHNPTVSIVSGSVIAKYIHHSEFTRKPDAESESTMKKAIPNSVCTVEPLAIKDPLMLDTLTATKVAGRKAMVNAAIVFMASLSRFVSNAILRDASAMAMLVRPSFCVIEFAT